MGWHQEMLGDSPNDLSKIKVLKLLFFVSAVDADSNNDGLLDIFNNYCALPYGPVESDIYDTLGNLGYFNVDTVGIVQKKEIDFIATLDDRLRIDSAVENLKRINPSLITLKPFDLVELSHKWSCWSIVYNFALDNGSYSHPIPVELIKAETKIFSLKEEVYEF